MCSENRIKKCKIKYKPKKKKFEWKLNFKMNEKLTVNWIQCTFIGIYQLNSFNRCHFIFFVCEILRNSIKMMSELRRGSAYMYFIYTINHMKNEKIDEQFICLLSTLLICTLIFVIFVFVCGQKFLLFFFLLNKQKFLCRRLR